MQWRERGWQAAAAAAAAARRALPAASAHSRAGLRRRVHQKTPTGLFGRSCSHARAPPLRRLPICHHQLRQIMACCTLLQREGWAAPRFTLPPTAAAQRRQACHALLAVALVAAFVLQCLQHHQFRSTQLTQTLRSPPPAWQAPCRCRAPAAPASRGSTGYPPAATSEQQRASSCWQPRRGKGQQ